MSIIKYFPIFLISLLKAPHVETSNTNDAILQRLEYLENKVSAQGSVIAELRERVTEVKHSNAELLSVNEDVQRENAKFLQINAELRKRNAELCQTSLKTQIQPEQNGIQPAKWFVLNNDGEGPVAFTAGIVPGSVDHLKHKDTIKFETVITDIGGGYNNQSGIFVAPVSGIYLFSCSLLDDNEEHGLMLHAEIVQSQRVLGRIFAHAEANYHRDQGAQTVVTYVHQGDQVWVRTIDNQNLGLGGELYSTFTGYLLLAMQFT